MILTQSFSGFVNHNALILSSGMEMRRGMLLSEHTLANALAVLPADATTSTLPVFSGSLAHTEYASVSLNEHVSIFAPFSGQYPEKVIYRLASPNSSARASLLYVIGAQDPFSVLLIGSQSAYL